MDRHSHVTFAPVSVNLLRHNMNADQKLVTSNFLIGSLLLHAWLFTDIPFISVEEKSLRTGKEKVGQRKISELEGKVASASTLLSDKGQKRTASSRKIYVIHDPDKPMISTCSLVPSSQPDPLSTASPLLPSPVPSTRTYLVAF